MTAAVYRWFSDQLEALTGPDALILGGVIVFISLFVGASLVGLWSMVAPDVKRKAAQVRSCIVRWHIGWINRKRKPQVWPIPFVEPQHSDPWPLRVTLAFVALVLAIMFECGFKGA